MKIIALIMLAAFALDLLAAAYFLPSWIAGGLLPPACVALYLLWPRRRAGAPDEIGWCLGPAIELSNPDRVERIEKAWRSSPKKRLREGISKKNQFCRKEVNWKCSVFPRPL